MCIKGKKSVAQAVEEYIKFIKPNYDTIVEPVF